MNTIVKRENKEIYRDGDKLVKVFDEKAFTKAQVLNEALNNARVEETGLKIPKLSMCQRLTAVGLSPVSISRELLLPIL